MGPGAFPLTLMGHWTRIPPRLAPAGASDKRSPGVEPLGGAGGPRLTDADRSDNLCAFLRRSNHPGQVWSLRSRGWGGKRRQVTWLAIVGDQTQSSHCKKRSFGVSVQGPLLEGEEGPCWRAAEVCGGLVFCL